MDKTEVRNALINVLCEIQKQGCFNEISITCDTYPKGDIQWFESPLWPGAIDKLSESIGFKIPLNKNIFVSHDGKSSLSVDQAAEAVCKLANDCRSQK